MLTSSTSKSVIYTPILTQTLRADGRWSIVIDFSDSLTDQSPDVTEEEATAASRDLDRWILTLGSGPGVFRAIVSADEYTHHINNPEEEE